ncbi:hypothetical protein VPH35_105635 [Triticum aestivum]
MPRKRKGDGDGIDDVPLKKARRPPPRNRASPSSLLLACKDMNDDRKGAIDDMDLTSLRNIQCDHLFNNLSVWLADLYDPNSREVVVPGRGRLPVNEEYVHRVMGVPHGGNDVPYNLPSEADIELGLELFGELGYAPKMTDLVDLIKGFENSDDTFKRMWLLLAGNTVIAPTTSNKVSPRWYAVLRDINGVKNLNWSKFIADELHKALLKCKPSRGCLLFYNLLYIHAIDLSGLGIELPDGPFPINVWTKKLITLVINKDVQADKVSFGKLPLKPEFGMNFCLFGGLEGLDKFMRVHTAPSCSEELVAAATVTAAVEDIASVAVAVERENEVVPNIVHDGSEAEKVVGSTRVNMPIDTATAGGQENDADNPVVTADPALELSTHGAGEYDGNFTPPNCSLGLDAIFAASPQVPPSTEATATAQAAPTLAQVPPAAPEAPAAAPSAQIPPAVPEGPATTPSAQVPPTAPEGPVAAPSAQVPPAAPATGPDAVLGHAAPVDADSKGKAMMEVTKAQPVAWAPPPNNSGK